MPHRERGSHDKARASRNLEKLARPFIELHRQIRACAILNDSVKACQGVRLRLVKSLLAIAKPIGAPWNFEELA